MIKHRIIGFFVALASIGWLIPLWLSFNAYLSFWISEGSILLYGETPVMHSFPKLVFAADSFLIAMLWLGLVLFCWCYIACTILLRRHQTNTDNKN